MSNLIPLFLNKTNGRLVAREQQGGSGTTFEARGFSYVQTSASILWLINHGMNTRLVMTMVLDQDNKMILPDEIEVVDPNNVTVRWAAPQTGTALLVSFETPL